MSYDYLCTLSRYNYSTNDYGTTTTFKLYGLDSSAFDASTYTGYVKVFNSAGMEVVTEISPSWTTQASGIGTFAFTSTNKIGASGRYRVEVQLEKSGTILTFKAINSIAVSESPTGTRTP
jgi:hypothetical protein